MPLRRALLSAASFFVVFFCVGFLYGGDRLLVSDRPAPPPLADASVPQPPAAVMPLCFTSDVQRAPVSPVRSDAPARTQKHQDRAAKEGITLRGNHTALLCDANGNVLQRVSYMEAVYCAFTLSDKGG